MPNTLPPSKHERLSRAVADARAQPGTGNARHIVQSRTIPRPVQRAVKFPKASNALRQLVTITREKADPSPTVRLRAPAPATALRATRSAAMRPPPGAVAARAHDSLVPVRTMRQVGDLVRHARRQRGLTQAELALSAGTGRRFVSDVEGGKPTVEFGRLLQLCRTLGVRLFADEPDDDQ